MNSENVSISSSLCLACGLCCDGTLIGFVELSKEEMPAINKIMDFEEEQGHGFFLQPCKKYCDGCTVYADRPKQCGLFECGLLKSVDQKELAFNSALEIIDEVKQRKSVIEDSIASLQIELHSPSFYFRMVELKKVLLKAQSGATFTENHSALLAHITELDHLLIEKFDVSLN